MENRVAFNSDPSFKLKKVKLEGRKEREVATAETGDDGTVVGGVNKWRAERKVVGKRQQVKKACVGCRQSCKKCEEVRPCSRCKHRNIPCEEAPGRKQRNVPGEALQTSSTTTISIVSLTPSSVPPAVIYPATIDTIKKEEEEEDASVSFQVIESLDGTTTAEFPTEKQEGCGVVRMENERSRYLSNASTNFSFDEEDGISDDMNPSLSLLSDICGMVDQIRPPHDSSL